MKRGEFKPFEASAELQCVDSIAYKLALVADGRADATGALDRKMSETSQPVCC